MTTYAITPEIEQHRSEADKHHEQGHALHLRVLSHNKRAPEIDREMADALASRDEKRVTALRAERAAIETELRDLANAVTVAEQRASEARSRAARAEYPLARKTLDDILARYDGQTLELIAATAELQAALNRASNLYSV